MRSLESLLRKTKPIQVFFDGLCQPCNPREVTCFSFIIKKDYNAVYREYGLAAYNSINNVAEYTGVIKVLEWLIQHNFMNEDIIVRGDSLLS